MVLIQTFLPSHPGMSGQPLQSSTGMDNQSSALAEMWKRVFDLIDSVVSCYWTSVKEVDMNYGIAGKVSRN